MKGEVPKNNDSKKDRLDKALRENLLRRKQNSKKEKPKV